MALCIDVSNYSGEISEQQARDLWAVGVRKVIVQIVNERILTHRQQIPVLLAQGFEVECYVYVWFSGGEQFVRDRTAWACRELSAFPTVSMLWLDCEQSSEDDPPFDHVNEPTTKIIAAAVETVTVRGLSTGIYTAQWWWVPGADNSTAFAHLPLWSADYDGDPTLTPAGYGGWAHPTVKQYQGTSTLAGVSGIDLNVYEAATGHTAPLVEPLPGGEFLPEPVEESDIGRIALDLVYGVKQGRVDLVEHGPSPARAGWTRLTVDYLP